MATKRLRKTGTWEFKIQRKGLLPKPIYLTFENEAAGNEYCRVLEAKLDAGIIPPEIAALATPGDTIGESIRSYLKAVSVPDSDVRVLNVLLERMGTDKVSAVKYDWAEDWISQLKRVDKLAPSTIRHHVGALARCFDWSVRKGSMGINPLRHLPRGYANYTAEDEKQAGLRRDDAERDRRLEEGEEVAIRGILRGKKQEGKQRSLTLEHRDKLTLLFDLALETGMRLREAYTIDVGQIDLSAKTIYLEKTKNGDRRQVGLSSVVIKALRPHLKTGGQLFPWWDGQQSSLRSVTSRLSGQFGRIFAAAECADLHYHDLRHEYTCRLYERTTMSDVEIGKQLGWKSLKMALRYANLRGSTIAGKLW